MKYELNVDKLSQRFLHVKRIRLHLLKNKDKTNSKENNSAIVSILLVLAMKETIIDQKNKLIFMFSKQKLWLEFFLIKRLIRQIFNFTYK